MVTDKRFEIMHNRLSTFSLEKLNRLNDAIFEGKVCYDEFNYNKDTGRYCPIAILMGLDKIEDPSDEKIKDLIGESFFPANAMKGETGDFYHGTEQDRESDLLGVLNIIICRKLLEKLNGEA